MSRITRHQSHVSDTFGKNVMVEVAKNLQVGIFFARKFPCWVLQLGQYS